MVSNVKISKEIYRSQHVSNYLTLVAKYEVKIWLIFGDQKLSPRAICNVIHEKTQKGCHPVK